MLLDVLEFAFDATFLGAKLSLLLNADFSRKLGQFLSHKKESKNVDTCVDILRCLVCTFLHKK